MITLRYHISSLAAVLLTLGIGIWIGTALGSPGLTRHQLALIKESNSKLDEEVAAREDDEKMLGVNRQALAGLVPHFTRSLLYGKHVAIIRLGDYPDAVQDANDALAQTGASVDSTITIGEQFDDVTDKEHRDILGSIAPLGDSTQTPSDNSDLVALMVTALKNGTTNHPDIEDAMQRMNSEGVVTFSGDFQQPVDLVIVVGGTSSAPGEFDTSDQQSRERTVLNTLLSSTGFSAASVVGCELRLVGTSSIPLYQSAGIGSVDCIDEPIGVLDLVYALHGEPATYGVKAGATLLAPASLEAEDGLI